MPNLHLALIADARDPKRGADGSLCRSRASGESFNCFSALVSFSVADAAADEVLFASSCCCCYCYQMLLFLHLQQLLSSSVNFRIGSFHARIESGVIVQRALGTAFLAEHECLAASPHLVVRAEQSIGIFLREPSRCNSMAPRD